MAAGLGFKDFTTGEVLTAADVDGYLMQGVWVFASAAARDAAVTSPQEGNFAYLKDTNVTTYYTGSAWANLDTTGMTNPMTTTGDTIYSSSGSTPARLGIGSSGQVLTVAGGVPSWATPSSGALTKIVSTTMSAVASQDFLNCFSGTYRSYLIEFSNIFDSGAVVSPTVNLNFYYSTNTDIGNGRYYGGMFAIGPTGASATALSTNAGNSWAFGRTAGGGSPSGGFLNISAAGSLGGSNTEYKNFAAQGQWMQCGEDYRSYVGGFNGNLNQAITGFKISLSGGNVSGTITVYGYQN